jgi:hypothetical protein
VEIIRKLNVRVSDTPRIIAAPECVGEKKLFGLLVRQHSDGSTELVHEKTGSGIRFDVDGNLSVIAAANARVTGKRYVFLGDEGSEQESDELNLDRVRRGDQQAIQELVVDGKLPHLLPKALEAYRQYLQTSSKLDSLA